MLYLVVIRFYFVCKDNEILWDCNRISYLLYGKVMLPMCFSVCFIIEFACLIIFRAFGRVFINAFSCLIMSIMPPSLIISNQRIDAPHMSCWWSAHNVLRVNTNGVEAELPCNINDWFGLKHYHKCVFFRWLKAVSFFLFI